MDLLLFPLKGTVLRCTRPSQRVPRTKLLASRAVGIVVFVVSLIDIPCGAVRKLLTKNSTSYYGKYTISLFRSIPKVIQKWQNLEEVLMSQKWNWLELWKIKTK